MTSNTRILAIETSARLGSVAAAENDQLLIEHHFSADHQHAGQLLPTMQAICQQLHWPPDSINHVYISAGPGSYTGMRIAITAAKTLAFATNARLVAVPSMDILAQNVLEATGILPPPRCPGLAKPPVSTDVPSTRQSTQPVTQQPPHGGPRSPAHQSAPCDPTVEPTACQPAASEQSTPNSMTGNALQPGPQPGEALAVVLDAKRKKLYTAVYRLQPPTTKNSEKTSPTPPTDTGPSASTDTSLPLIPFFELLTPATTMPPAELLDSAPRPLYLIGDGLRFHAQALQNDGVIPLDEPLWLPHARHCLRCGRLRAEAGLFSLPEQLTPIYLRRPEAVEKWERLHGPNP